MKRHPGFDLTSRSHGHAMKALLAEASAAAGEGRMAHMLDALLLAAAVAERGDAGDEARSVLRRAIVFAARVGDDPRRVELEVSLAGITDERVPIDPLLERAFALQRFDLLALAFLTRSWRSWVDGAVDAAHEDALRAVQIALAAQAPSVYTVAALQLADLCEARSDWVGAFGLVHSVAVQADHLGGEIVRRVAVDALSSMWTRWGHGRYAAAQAGWKHRGMVGSEPVR